MPEKYFTYKSLDDLRKDVQKLCVDITFEEKLEAISRPVTIGPRTIGNAMGIHPMEGCDGTLEGRPGDLTYRRWQRFGEGGAKLIWGEATAVVPEGLANSRQLLINERNLPEFAKLVMITRDAHRARYGTDSDLMIGLQLTHSGRWSYRAPVIAYHHPQADLVTYVDKKNGIRIDPSYPVVSDDELEHLEDAYVKAAKLAHAAGFDFVDIKQCHTYLLNELLGARTRPGMYGGPFENRTRMIRNILGKIRNETGDSLILASRLNVYDGVPFELDTQTGAGRPIQFEIPYRYNFGVDTNDPLKPDFSESIALVRMMREQGLHLLNVSMGSPYYNMHYGRPFEKKPFDGYETPEHPLLGVARHFDAAAKIQEAFPELAVVGTGYSWLQKYLIQAGESNLRRRRVSIIAVGRGAIAYPDFAVDALTKGELNPSQVCIAISYCTNLMRSKNNELGQYPSGCVPRDDVYAPIYKEVLAKRKAEGKP
ncbi:MAG TPA: NADH:flavin oxidoreductase [Bacteroidota bacterium]|nr:NADH:flavin oxidoreductase [Bacteroidota bacterium]